MSFENPQIHSVFQQPSYGCQYVFNFIYVIVCVCVCILSNIYILCTCVWRDLRINDRKYLRYLNKQVIWIFRKKVILTVMRNITKQA